MSTQNLYIIVYSSFITTGPKLKITKMSLSQWIVEQTMEYICCYCSVTKSCLSLCNTMACSTPGFPVLHHLSEFSQVPLAWGGSSTARVLLRLCPESACQTGPSLELSCRLEAGGCAVRASPWGLGSLAQPQRRGTSPWSVSPGQLLWSQVWNPMPGTRERRAWLPAGACKPSKICPLLSTSMDAVESTLLAQCYPPLT